MAQRPGDDPSLLEARDMGGIHVESSGASPIRNTGKRDTKRQDRELRELLGREA